MTPEQQLGSFYVLEERIGEGGLGVVWRGRDTSTGVACAIKLLRAENSPRTATATSGWRAVEVPARDETMVPASVPEGMTSDRPAELSGFSSPFDVRSNQFDCGNRRFPPL